MEQTLLALARQGEYKGLLESIIEPWAKSGLAPQALAGTLSLPQMRAIVRLLYICGHRVLGPAEAGRLLAQAIAKASQMDEAKHFTPQKLR